MDKIPNFFVINSESFYMKQGSVGFIPAWIFLLLVVFSIAVLFPKKFERKDAIISPYLFAFIVGSLMPIFDDLLAFVIGPPFAHHSLFHSLLTGPTITFVIFYLFSGKRVAIYAWFGNLAHTFFNFTFDVVTLFFPLTYQEFGLTQLIKINTYWIKAVGYPVILIGFFSSVYIFFRKLRN